MEDKIKICLVFPRLKYISGDPPIGVGYLVSYLKQNSNADISVIDSTFNRSRDYILRALKQNQPDIIGIYSDVVMAQDAMAIAAWAKENKFFTVLGGPQPTVKPGAFMPYADIVVRGEGESVFLQIINNFRDKKFSAISGIYWKKGEEVIANNPNENFLDLEKLPVASRALFAMDKYIYHWNYLDAHDNKRRGTTMIVSRGCPFSCSYCQPTIREMFGARLRFCSPGKVVEEIGLLQDEYNIEAIFFHDDTFTVDHNWLKEFCRSLEDSKLPILWGCNSRVDTVNEQLLLDMYRVGLRAIHFGIESGSQRILDQIYNKRIKLQQAKDAVDAARRVGIHTMGFFMLGAPSETLGEINKTISFAKGLRLEEATFSLTTPLAGTRLFDMVSSSQKYSVGETSDNFNYYSKYSLQGGLSLRLMKFLQFKALFSFYAHPYRFKYIIKHFFSMKGVKKLLNKIRRFI